MVGFKLKQLDILQYSSKVVVCSSISTFLFLFFHSWSFFLFSSSITYTILPSRFVFIGLNRFIILHIVFSSSRTARDRILIILLPSTNNVFYKRVSRISE